MVSGGRCVQGPGSPLATSQACQAWPEEDGAGLSLWWWGNSPVEHWLFVCSDLSAYVELPLLGTAAQHLSYSACLCWEQQHSLPHSAYVELGTAEQHLPLSLHTLNYLCWEQQHRVASLCLCICTS